MMVSNTGLMNGSMVESTQIAKLSEAWSMSLESPGTFSRKDVKLRGSVRNKADQKDVPFHDFVPES